VEFTFVLPILLIMFLGSFDLVSLLAAGNRLELIAANVADMTSQGEAGGVVMTCASASATNCTLFKAMKSVTDHIDAVEWPRMTKGYVVISLVQRDTSPSTDIKIKWQYCNSGNAAIYPDKVLSNNNPLFGNHASKLGQTGLTASNLPSPLNNSPTDPLAPGLGFGDEAIVVEVVGKFESKFSPFSQILQPDLYRIKTIVPNDPNPKKYPNYAGKLAVLSTPCP